MDVSVASLLSMGFLVCPRCLSVHAGAAGECRVCDSAHEAFRVHLEGDRYNIHGASQPDADAPDPALRASLDALPQRGVDFGAFLQRTAGAGEGDLCHFLERRGVGR